MGKTEIKAIVEEALRNYRDRATNYGPLDSLPGDWGLSQEAETEILDAIGNLGMFWVHLKAAEDLKIMAETGTNQTDAMRGRFLFQRETENFFKFKIKLHGVPKGEGYFYYPKLAKKPPKRLVLYRGKIPLGDTP